MKTSRHCLVLGMLGLIPDISFVLVSGGSEPLMPLRNATAHSSHTVAAAGQTLHQRPPKDTSLAISLSQAGRKMIKPATIAAADASQPDRATTPSPTAHPSAGEPEFSIGDVFVAIGDGKVQWRSSAGALLRVLETGKG